MIVDTSAIVAIVFQEPGFGIIQAKLNEADAVGIGTPTLCETGIVLSARMRTDARPLIRAFVDEGGFVLIPFSDEHWKAAVGAYLRFGKGRHAAALNFGDCMSYATATLADQSLLFVGEDFSRTDIVAA